MSLDGMGVEQIADTLSKEEILPPVSTGRPKASREPEKRPNMGPAIGTALPSPKS